MCLTRNAEERLRVFERKIIRKIQEPKKIREEEYGRMRIYEIEGDIFKLTKGTKHTLV